MRSWSVLVAAACSLFGPDSAAATESNSTTLGDPPLQGTTYPRVRAIETQGVVVAHLLPRTGFGTELALVLGVPNFQLRLGGMLVGVPGFRLGPGTLSNILHVGSVDVCAAKQVLTHQIRMCMGGQAGGMTHRWSGYTNPGRSRTPWVAGTLRSDYQLTLGDHFGVIAGVAATIPVVGPTFRSADRFGTPTPVIYPGPMTGLISLGTTYRW